MLLKSRSLNISTVKDLKQSLFTLPNLGKLDKPSSCFDLPESWNIYPKSVSDLSHKAVQ